MAEKTKQKRILKAKHKDLIFYISLMIWPVLQFCVFYIFVNINSVLLTFQELDIVTGQINWTFNNITAVFKMMTMDNTFINMFKNSALNYFLTTVISIPLGLLFSYYIAKKFPLSGVFRVLLFLPSILSSIVMVTMYKFFIERALPTVLNDMFGTNFVGFLENSDTNYGMLVFYAIWTGFGSNVLLYSNRMNSIQPEIIEAANLDGATGLKEFWYITLPLVYPMFVTFFTMGVMGIFTNTLGIFAFYGDGAPSELWTYGYYMYVQTKAATSMAEYPRIATMGIMMTIVVVPITFLVRHLLEKYGPSED